MSAVTTTVDAFLDGRLMIEQPARGYRAGLDAVLLGTSCPLTPGQDVLDVGAGVGTVGFIASARAADIRVTLVERDPVFVALARANVQRNRLEGRVRVVAADVSQPLTRSPDMAHARERFDVALMNPPFFDDGHGTPSPDARKGGAHSMERGALDDWIRFAAAMLRPGGHLSMIHRTEALGDALDALRGRFGAVEMVAVHPVANRPANRIVLRAIKASRAPFRILPPLSVQSANGAPTSRVEAATRSGHAWL